ncbi:hypothetical protein K504DRAFT_390651 [Pleomassaria siparia CBS 279.74]|uniref:Thioredoxin-like fold domain-containing protein n=1 Tax=Pleomassaria siparia CBS 279.74 TaxID=1314801 RepID=A0A6G1JUT0_9PLEO|nr:hypothetical protein K504DRAFT_390651 [Pleomassaria siparia CBS 279.74]
MSTFITTTAAAAAPPPARTNKITLFRGWHAPGQYVWSPFVTKVEFRLRTSNTPYTCASGSPSAGPKGKIPYVEVVEIEVETGTDANANATKDTLADSSLILKTLASKGLIADVNATLGAKEKGVDLAIRALLEDKLYFYHTHERWINNYHVMRDHALHTIPYPVRVVVGLLAYRGNVQKLHDQGTGRFSDVEIRGFVEEIWTGVSGMLEESRRKGDREGKYHECYWVLGGEEPTEADATLYGFVNSVLIAKAGPESCALLRGKFPVVVDYAERIHRRWFPDYETFV